MRGRSNTEAKWCTHVLALTRYRLRSRPGSRNAQRGQHDVVVHSKSASSPDKVQANEAKSSFFRISPIREIREKNPFNFVFCKGLGKKGRVCVSVRYGGAALALIMRSVLGDS
jgi:hypothetical protein